MITHLFVQVLQFVSGQLELRHLGQHRVPPATCHVSHKRVQAVHRVQRHLALALKGSTRLHQCVLLAELENNLHHAVGGREVGFGGSGFWGV